MAKKKQKKNLGPWLFILSMLIVLILHYFFISKINVHSTIQVAISFILILLFSGLLSIIFDKNLHQ
jgi:hypothetical protein